MLGRRKMLRLVVGEASLLLLPCLGVLNRIHRLYYQKFQINSYYYSLAGWFVSYETGVFV